MIQALQQIKGGMPDATLGNVSMVAVGHLYTVELIYK